MSFLYVYHLQIITASEKMTPDFSKFEHEDFYKNVKLINSTILLLIYVMKNISIKKLSLTSLFDFSLRKIQ